MMMIAAIGLRYHYEYDRGYNEEFEYNVTVAVGNASINYNYTEYTLSGQLWYMIFTGYVAPTLGMIMFLLMCHYWTREESTLKLILDTMKVMEVDGDSERGSNKTVENFDELDKGIGECYSLSLVYPFMDPVRIILSLLYAAMLVAFGVCATINGPRPTENLIALYPVCGTWGAVALVVNIYTMAVAIVWTAILVVAIALAPLWLVLCVIIHVTYACYIKKQN